MSRREALLILGRFPKPQRGNSPAPLKWCFGDTWAIYYESNEEFEGRSPSMAVCGQAKPVRNNNQSPVPGLPQPPAIWLGNCGSRGIMSLAGFGAEPQKNLFTNFNKTSTA